MKVTERKLGRVFHLQLEPGDDFFGCVNPFIKEKDIRSGFGASRRRRWRRCDVDRRRPVKPDVCGGQPLRISMTMMRIRSTSPSPPLG